MKLATIQHKKILKPLIKNRIHIADFNHIFDDIEKDYSSLNAAYQFMMNHYGYKDPPIFCCVVGKISDFRNTKNYKNIILFELDVPDEFVKLQSFYDWNNIVWYIENMTRYTRHEPFDEYHRNVLNGLNLDEYGAVFQATIPYINPNWIKHIYNVDKKFMDLFISGSYLTDPSNYNLKEIICNF